MTRLTKALVLAGCALFASSCSKEGCLSGDADCKVPPPCPKVALTCDASAASKLDVKTIARASDRSGGLDAIGAKGDVKLSNAFTEVTIAGMGNQNLLDPNGGSILDLLPAGTSKDSVNQILQVVGILPGDAAHYTKLEIIDERPARVAVQVKGALDGRKNVWIYTRYELTPCDRGVRVRTEVVNASVDTEMWSLVDGYYWSGREALPFTPAAGAGFKHPSFSLLTINDAYETFPYLAASGHSNDEQISAIAAVSCTDETMEGFQSDQISAAGKKRTIVPSRGAMIFERYIAVADSKGVGGAVDLARQIRSQVVGEKLVKLTGKVERLNARRLDGERETSIVISEGSLGQPVEKRVPVSQVVPDKDGTFSALVKAGQGYVVEVHSFGVKVVEKDFTTANDDTQLGTFTLPSTATVNFIVKDDSSQPIDAEIFVVPADAATKEAVAGTFHGRFTTCTPWLGPPPGASPACNRVLVKSGVGSAEVPVGKFHFYAFHGPFASLGHEVSQVAAGTSSLAFTLKTLDLLPSQALSADMHVHGASSFDSSIPDMDRVLSFSASDLPVIIATDHDNVGDYTKTIADLGYAQRMTAVNGVETTGHIPFMFIPHYGFPLVIGHYNFWPITFDPSLPRNGGPFDELVEPGELFQRTKPLFSGTPLIELNHPWADPEFGRDLGFPRALSLDMTKNLPAQDDGSAMGMMVRVPKTGGATFANDAHHAQEVMNGSSNAQYLQYRAFWFYMLNQGKLRTGTANSDSHSLTDNTVGMPRNVVATNVQAGPSFDVNTFNEAVQKGLLLGTNGPVIEASMLDASNSRHSYSLSPFPPKHDGKVQVKVKSAPWIPVDEVRFVVNGQVVKTITGLTPPADPFASDGSFVRYEGEVLLSELLTGVSGDAWLVIEAGRALPLTGDLGGGLENARDGVPDTTDNNGDGVVDVKDVKEGQKIGPLADLPEPKDGDRGFEYFSITGGSPCAFTNPFVLDRDGDGKFSAPGVKEGI